ncbi:response regulator [Pelomicrobium methylotrophicum]|uniref:Response regulator transcription factor n=1 Tax=Pelomicrobium methylotrophicum TaxID=2602750 RepID=A0A5C7EKB6_9PROT|nr:response regulator transcription factor [Pelomicrobium methylotrophicum]TXF11794.1 response regulator transcription factor [Pelomicrobium methylotrophicum]
MIRVLIVDDHAVVRHGLKQILNDTGDLRVAGEAGDGVEAIQWLRRHGDDCHVVLLDISMPNKGGLDTLSQIHREFPRLPVLVLSMYPEDVIGLRTLKAGAAGYLTKQAAAEQLVEAIRQVASGHRYVSPALAEQLADSFVNGYQGAPHELLSDREYQTLCLIASGKTLSQIAEELKISIKTVSVYRARLLEKMKLKNNAELTRYAVSKGLVD